MESEMGFLAGLSNQWFYKRWIVYLLDGDGVGFGHWGSDLGGFE